VSNYGKQAPAGDIGVDAFEFWCPVRRPEGYNIAMKFAPYLRCFSPANVISGTDRPVMAPNAWVASTADLQPQLFLDWDAPTTIRRIILSFDTDFDHPMESSLMGHPENVMPFCVRNYQLRDENGRLLFSKRGNYQSVNHIYLEEPVTVKRLSLLVEHPSEDIPAAIFSIRCY